MQDRLATQKKRITLRDIAGEVGLHVSTVSRALDPNMRNFISEEVANRVLETARSMGYRPNRMAYGLRTNRSMTTGILIPDIANVIFPPIVRGVEAVLEPLGYASFIVNTDNRGKREQWLMDALHDRGVDGVIHAAASRQDPACIEMVRQGIPIVTVNRRLEGTVIPCVVNDEASGIAAVLEHLRQLGHAAIAHIAGQQDSSTGYARLEAFRANCVSAARGELPHPIVFSRGYTRREGYRCMIELLDRNVPLTAVVAANDMLALGAIAALRDRGLRCPEDVSVTGFNDMPFLDLIPPALTTVRIEQFSAGKAAAELLLALMRNEDVGEGVVLPVSLVVRDSTCPPPG
jgi:LacI family transcriptional regulator